MGVKYIWWHYARNMIRVYPEREKQYNDLLDSVPRPFLDGVPHGRNNGDPVGQQLARIERAAIYKEYWAVRKALDVCRYVNPDFMEFVRLYYWRRPGLSLQGVANHLHYSIETINKWNRKLIYNVALYRGLLDQTPPTNGRKG